MRSLKLKHPKSIKQTFLSCLFEYFKETPGVFVIAFSRDTLQGKLMRLGGYNKKVFSNHFTNLKKRGLINKRKSRFYFTSEAKSWFEKKKYRNIFLDEKKHDGYWRMIIFDIPEDMKNLREHFRRKLEFLGCFLFQKSVLITPFNCDEELNFIVNYLGLGEYVELVKVKSLGKREHELRKIFDT